MQQTNVELEVMEIVNRNLQAIWDADTAAYKETCAPDVSFFEWYITTQRIDGIDFHLREILVHAEALGGGSDARTEHEILQPRAGIWRHGHRYLHAAGAVGQRRRSPAHPTKRDACPAPL